MDFLKQFLPMYEADKGGQGGDDPSTNPEGGQGDDKPDADPNNTDKNIPYDRFKQVNDNYKDIKQKYDELIKQQEKDQEESKKKQGEYESLYNDLKGKHDPMSQELEQYKETFKSMLDGKKKNVPKDMQDLIPQGNELEQLKWIEQAENKGLFNKQQPKDFGNAGSNPDDSKKKSKLGISKLSRF